MGINKDKVVQKYNSLDRIWSSEDKWHKRTYATIQSFIEKYVVPLTQEDNFILNAGSAGNPYGLPEKNMQHLDIANEKIAHLPNAKVGSIENIPFPDETYNTIICVGSVLNYADPMKAIQEFNRVLLPGGFLVVEFENSNTLELVFKKDFNKKAVFVDTFYYGKEQLWYYSDTWINEIIGLNKFETIRRYKFHYLSAFMYRFTKNENKAGKFFELDPLFRFIPFIRNLASNTIILCQKKN